MEVQSCVLLAAPVHLTNLPITKPISSTTFPVDTLQNLKNQDHVPLASREATRRDVVRIRCSLLFREQPLRTNVGKQEGERDSFCAGEQRYVEDPCRAMFSSTSADPNLTSCRWFLAHFVLLVPHFNDCCDLFSSASQFDVTDIQGPKPHWQACRRLLGMRSGVMLSGWVRGRAL